MAKITNLLKKKNDGGIKAQETIAKLSRDKTELCVQIETTVFKFYSRLRLRSGAIIFGYPQVLQKLIPEKGRVRVRIPDSDQELCLEISSSQFGGSGSMSTELGTMNLMCKLPGATIEKSRRSSERYFTGSFKDLALRLQKIPKDFRVLDMSKSGLKIQAANGDFAENFPIGSHISAGVIRLGSKASVDLENVVPRTHYPQAIGLEIDVNPEGRSSKLIEIFLERLESEEKSRGTVLEDEGSSTSDGSTLSPKL